MARGATGGSQVIDHVAALDINNNGDGTYQINGAAVIDGVTMKVDWQAPAFMFDAILDAARKAGALHE